MTQLLEQARNVHSSNKCLLERVETPAYGPPELLFKSFYSKWKGKYDYQKFWTTVLNAENWASWGNSLLCTARHLLRVTLRREGNGLNGDYDNSSRLKRYYLSPFLWAKRSFEAEIVPLLSFNSVATRKIYFKEKNLERRICIISIRIMWNSTLGAIE